MIRVKAKLRAPRLDMTNYRARTSKAASETLAQAMFEFVVTAQAVIPVWSGASHATLTTLAQLAGMPLVITPTAANRPTLVSNGLAKGASSGDAKRSDANDQFSFSYTTDLPHLIYNEYNNANVERPPELFSELIHPGPYRFQEQTKNAVMSVLSQFRLPDPRANQTIKRISVR